MSPPMVWRAMCRPHEDFAMLRIHELKLPLDHAEAALRQAILKRLSITDQALVSFTVFKRAYDARKTSAIQLIYTIDASVKDEAGVLKRLSKDSRSARRRT
jgi:uncharacterized FAD-dependent dehydrogenase